MALVLPVPLRSIRRRFSSVILLKLVVMGINLLIPYMHYGLNGSICNVERKQYCGGEDRERKSRFYSLKKGSFTIKKDHFTLLKGSFFRLKDSFLSRKDCFPPFFHSCTYISSYRAGCSLYVRACVIVVLLTFYVSHLSHVSKSHS